MRTIRIYPDSILRKKSDSVDKVSSQIQRLADDMIQTLRWANGVGLAAPQIGELVRVIIIDLSIEDSSKEPLCIINPEIVGQKGLQVTEEGCLSIPEVYERLERSSSVLVRGLDMRGNRIEQEFHNILARAALHEIDHLDGILFIDRLTPLRKAFLKSKLKKLRGDSDPQRSSL